MLKTNTSKILKTVALAGALTAAGTVATTARADAATSDTPAQAPSSATTADQQLTDLKSQQAIDENQAANSNAATMKAASDAADKQIAAINGQIASRQADNAAASQAAVASQTDAINSAAQSATDAENASYSAAVAKQSAANDAVLEAAQAKVVTEQQKAQQTAQENAAFQSKAGKLAAEHEATINKIDAAADNQTKGINQQIAAAQKAVENARADAAKQADGQIAAAAKKADAAQETVNNDQQVVNAKQAAVDAAQQAAKNSQKIQTTDRLNVPQDYINVWKKYYEDIHGFSLDQNVNADLWQRNKTASAEAKKLNRDFVASNEDQAASVSFNSDGTLSRADVITATKYAAELINPIREAIGVAPYQITNASIDTTIENTRQYRAKGHNDWKDGHDGALLKKVGADWGTDALGESLAGDYAISRKLINKQTVSVADLKKAVHNAVVALLFEGADNSANGHTTDLLGVRYVYSSVLCGGSDFLGVDYDLDPVHQNGWIRFNSIADGKSPRVQNLVKQGYNVREGQATDKTIQGSNYDKIAVPTPDSQAAAEFSSQLTALFARAASDDQTSSLDTVQTAADELKAAQDKLNQDQQVLAAAQAKLNDLKTNRAKLIQDLSDDSATSSLLQNLQDQLGQVKINHDSAIKAENADYAANRAALKKDHEAKLAAIKAQPGDVDALKAELQGKLDALKKDHESRLAAIQDAAKAEIANIKPASVADPEIDKLQAKINAIKDNLAKQQAMLDNQFAALQAKNQEEYNALEKKLQNTSTAAAKGHNDHYTTADGQQEVILPDNDSHQSTDQQVAKPSDSQESQITKTNDNRGSQTSEQKASKPIVSAPTPAEPSIPADAVKPEAGQPVSDNHDVAYDNETMTAAAVDGNVIANGSTAKAPVEHQASVGINVPADKLTPMNHEAVKDGELPQTGNQSGIIAMVLGTMTALFSLGLAAKKRY